MSDTLQSPAKADMATQSTTDSSEISESIFFKLPPELRLIVYEMVLSDVDFIQNRALEPRLTRTPLLSICHPIQNEALPLYMKHLCHISIESTKRAIDSIQEGKGLLLPLPGPAPKKLLAWLRRAAKVLRATVKVSTYHGKCYLVMLEEIEKQLVRLNWVAPASVECNLIESEAAVDEFKQARLEVVDM